MRRERATRIGVCVLLLATVVLTGCRLAEHGRRAAIDAFASFVLDSVLQAPLSQPAPNVSGGQAPAPVLSAVVPPPGDRHECLSSIEPLPLPPPRIVAIDLTPACRRLPHMPKADAARLRGEARMNVAELRARRIVVVAPIAPEPPATL